MYAEEVDWCYRMKKKGWEVYYCSDAEVIHLGGGSAQQKSSKQLIYLYYSKSLFLMKHQSPLSSRIFRTAVKIFAFVKSVFYFVSSIINKNHYAVFKNYWELFQWDWV
jgi:GT2 family glycosyltransferase